MYLGEEKEIVSFELFQIQKAIHILVILRNQERRVQGKGSYAREPTPKCSKVWHAWVGDRSTSFLAPFRCDPNNESSEEEGKQPRFFAHQLIRPWKNWRLHTLWHSYTGKWTVFWCRRFCGTNKSSAGHAKKFGSSLLNWPSTTSRARSPTETSGSRSDLSVMGAWVVRSELASFLSLPLHSFRKIPHWFILPFIRLLYDFAEGFAKNGRLPGQFQIAANLESETLIARFITMADSGSALGALNCPSQRSFKKEDCSLENISDQKRVPGRIGSHRWQTLSKLQRWQHTQKW